MLAMIMPRRSLPLRDAGGRIGIFLQKPTSGRCELFLVDHRHGLTAIAFRTARPWFVTIVNESSAIAARARGEQRIQNQIRQRSMRPDRLEAACDNRPGILSTWKTC